MTPRSLWQASGLLWLPSQLHFRGPILFSRKWLLRGVSARLFRIANTFLSGESIHQRHRELEAEMLEKLGRVIHRAVVALIIVSVFPIFTIAQSPSTAPTQPVRVGDATIDGS